jgi:hemoglobin-like flavoprotein
MSLNTALIAETFDRAKKENGGTRVLGLRFYQRLFEKYPGVRPLFHTPPEEQHKKLMASVGAIVASVNQPEVMVPYLHAMGIRHLAYQTLSAHYPAVSENLVAVLSEHLSQEGEWTEEMQTQWKTAMDTVSAVMTEAAEDPARFSAELEAAGYEPNGFRPGSTTPWELPAA